MWWLRTRWKGSCQLMNNNLKFLTRFRGPHRAWYRYASKDHRRQDARDSERGDANIEFVIWGSALVLTILLGLYAFRLSAARGEIQDSAQAGARAASLARTPTEAASVGQDAALGSLPVTEPICRTATASVDTSQWAAGWVQVTVSCTVDFSGLNPIAAGTQTVDYTWTEPVDQARTGVRP